MRKMNEGKYCEGDIVIVSQERWNREGVDIKNEVMCVIYRKEIVMDNVYYSLIPVDDNDYLSDGLLWREDYIVRLIISGKKLKKLLENI